MGDILRTYVRIKSQFGICTMQLYVRRYTKETKSDTYVRTYVHMYRRTPSSGPGQVDARGHITTHRPSAQPVYALGSRHPRSSLSLGWTKFLSASHHVVLYGKKKVPAPTHRPSAQPVYALGSRHPRSSLSLGRTKFLSASHHFVLYGKKKVPAPTHRPSAQPVYALGSRHPRSSLSLGRTKFLRICFAPKFAAEPSPLARDSGKDSGLGGKKRESCELRKFRFVSSKTSFVFHPRAPGARATPGLVLRDSTPHVYQK